MTEQGPGSDDEGGTGGFSGPQIEGYPSTQSAQPKTGRTPFATKNTEKQSGPRRQVGQPFLTLSEKERAVLTRKVLALGARARVDLKTFFSMVMREEKTQRRIACAPHQRVLFDFVEAFPACVVRMPAGASKTYCMAALTLFLLGRDVTVRGAIVSATQEQAKKPLGMVRDYIEESKALQLVFPKMIRSSRPQDPWTQTAITVERPHGIRDPSLVAVGVDGSLPGARLAWIIVDDILDRENTSNPAGRHKVHEFFDSTVMSRLDEEGARLVVTNTPWHPDDLTHRLEKAGWPTLTMDVEGGVHLSNVPDDWDSNDIRPGRKAGEWYRLTEHDAPEFDEGEARSLWDAKFSPTRITELRRNHLPHRYNQLFMCQCRDEETARCKLEWIDACKAAGRGLQLQGDYTGQNITVTGVDLAVGQKDEHDETAFFTIELIPGGKRRILDIEYGRFDGPTIVRKVIEKAQAYKSIVRVENNSAQDYILQFARAQNASVPVKAHTTGRNKAHPEYGIEGMFIEIKNVAWIIPSDETGHVHKSVQRWINECLYFEPDPRVHTGDVLMASWFAREQVREMGDGMFLADGRSGGIIGLGAPSIGMGIMSR